MACGRLRCAWMTSLCGTLGCCCCARKCTPYDRAWSGYRLCSVERLQLLIAELRPRKSGGAQERAAAVWGRFGLRMTPFRHCEFDDRVLQIIA